MNDCEEWLPVIGYEGLYEVSSLGRVRSRYAILNPVLQSTGYFSVTLYRKGSKRVTKHVHRLVAEAFLVKEAGKPLVLHWDDNPVNNRLENLRWGDTSDNVLDSVRNGSHYNASKTHCPRGHLLSEENLKLISQGRTCRICANESSNKAYHQNKITPRLDGFRHGTPSGYGYYRCRCGECREAHRKRAEAYREGKREAPN